MNKITRRLFGFALASMLAVPASTGTALAQAAPDLSKVVLRIGDQTGLVRGKLTAAKLLDDVPYTIEWSVFPAAVNLHEALKADAVDIGSAADSPTVTAIAGGSDIAVVAAWTNGGLGTSLIVPKGSPIKTVADLKGKTLSPTTRGSVAHFLTLGALKEAGLSPSDVKLAFLAPSDAIAAFQSGSIDAWTTWGVYTARAIGTLGATEIRDGRGVNTGLGVLSANRKALADPGKVAAIADFADRIERGYDWSRRERDGYLDFYAGFVKQDRALVDTLYDQEEAFKRVTIDDSFVATLQKTYDTWVEAGVLKGSRDIGANVYRDLPVAAATN